MMLDGTDRVQTAIQRLQAFEPPEGYFLAFGGGKDSIVIKRLAQMAGVKFEAHYHVTTVDPPELVSYIRLHHPDAVFDLPKMSMWELIKDRGVPPTRVSRYCCQELKEINGKGCVVITGVRWAESPRRKQKHGVISTKRLVLNEDNDEARRYVESCYRTQKTMLNPIIDWSDAEVWNFIREEGLSYCSLYDEGFSRLGCIGCPMINSMPRKIEFARWPKYRDAYIRAFDRMLAQRREKGKESGDWIDGDSVMSWWLRDRPSTDMQEGQLELEAMR